MNSRKDPKERRRHKRFRVQDGTLVVYGGYPATVGPIIDISMGGLAFRYTAAEELPKEPSKVDILLSDRLSHLYGLPCETVYDLGMERSGSCPSEARRRRGIKFGELTPHQALQLEHFIQNLTTGEV